MKLNWNKGDGLVPAIIQDSQSHQVMMLGYMNEESFKLTQETGIVTFFSRSRNAVWMKGETSGNIMEVVDLSQDCDEDALLIRVKPKGPVCHRNTVSCFDHEYEFIRELDGIITNRITGESQDSYVSQLVQSGIDRLIQKVGEEAIETVIASKNDDTQALENEAADLVFHLMVLLQCKETRLENIVKILKQRHLGSLDKKIKPDFAPIGQN